MTPIEQAREQLAAAQQRVRELEQALRQLSNDYAAAHAAGNVDEANKINARISELAIEHRIAGSGGGGHLADAQLAVNRAQRDLREAKNRVANLNNMTNRLQQESLVALEQANVLTRAFGQAQEQLAAAREQLAQLEPPEQPAAAPEPEPEPAPVSEVERDPVWPQPSRVVHDFPTRYYTRATDGTEIPCDANGRPLDLSEQPAPRPEPGRKVDTQV
jgi:hypothetical protein